MRKLRIVGILLIILGALLFCLGVLFKILHWPGLYLLLISGPIMFILGFALIFLKPKVQ